MSSVQNIMCLLFPTGYRGTHYSHIPNKQGDQKFDHRYPQCLPFCGQRCKTNLKCKEIRASDRLKPPISTLLTLLFYVLLSRFSFALQGAFLQFKHR